MIKWLTLEEVKALPKVLDRETQLISLPLDLTSDDDRFSIPKVEGQTGPISKEHYVMVGETLVMIEQDSWVPGVAGIFMFYPRQGEDWTNLRILEALEPPLRVKHVSHLWSRTKHDEFLVIRPNARGWEIPLYRAASESEAHNLLAYLHQDDYNRACFVAPPEPEGEWDLVEQNGIKERTLGIFRSKYSALDHARCSASTGKAYVVRHHSNPRSASIYRISEGRITNKTPPKQL